MRNDCRWSVEATARLKLDQHLPLRRIPRDWRGPEGACYSTRSLQDRRRLAPALDIGRLSITSQKTPETVLMTHSALYYVFSKQPELHKVSKCSGMQMSTCQKVGIMVLVTLERHVTVCLGEGYDKQGFEELLHTHEQKNHTPEIHGQKGTNELDMSRRCK